jgi:H+-transporting ATPase
MVLTRPGLGGVRDAVETGRRIYQRMLTYTLNKIIKTFQVSLFLSLGLLLTNTFVTTPLLVLLLLFANDFVTMSLAADRVSSSPRPERWHVQPLALAGLALALAWVLFSFSVFFVGRDVLHLELARVQTLVFLMLVFTGQATVYLVRQRGPFWSSRPGGWLLLSTAGDLLAVSVLATQGILMAPVAAPLIAGLLAATAVCFVALDFFKVWLFARLRVA